MPARSGHFAALDSTDKKVYRLCSGLSSEAYNPELIERIKLVNMTFI